MSGETLAAFRAAARKCAGVMRESAEYVQKEMGSVTAAQQHREAIRKVCDAFVGNWFDIGTELDEMLDLGLPDYAPKVRARVDRIHRWLGECLPALDEVVRALGAAAEADAQRRSAYVLVAESAAKVLGSYAEVSAARERYLEACEREAGG